MASSSSSSSSSSSPHTFSLILSLLTILPLSLSLSLSLSPDVHELLPKYGFPKGLVPNNVVSYTLSDDGAFEIKLQNPCYVQFDRLVYYDTTIKGKMNYGSVSDVSGIQAKKLFVWVSISAIKVDEGNGMIEFYVGPLSERLPIKQFEVVPQCRRSGCEGRKEGVVSTSSF